MKRMLASALTLVLLAAALSGCAAAQEREPISISMTIAETLPSCVAFEADCFYAYDAEGKLYRVLWTDFEGLHEKDRVLVEYTERKEFSYPEYGSGWSPKYEIIATRVELESNAPASCLTHTSGTYTLTLPQSGKTLRLTEEQERFVPYITDALVEAAERKLARDAAGFSEHSGLYLQTNEDYLWLCCEVIRFFEDPGECEEGHEHLFYSERISTQAVPMDPGIAIGIAAFTESSTIYLSGAYKTYALSRLLWWQRDNGDGTFTETTVDVYGIEDLVNGNAPEAMPKIPTLLLDGPVTFLVPVNGEVERVSLLTEGKDGFTKRETTFEELSELEPGTYYVAAYVLFSGNCDPDAPQHASRYEDVFRLEVPEQTDNE